MTPEITNGVELTPEEISHNLSIVKRNVEDACIRVGRDPKEVTVCAVSKLKPVEDIQAAMAAGQTLFGENYVQEIQKKYELLGAEPEWHMIGHLQKNKVKYIVDKVTLIHSIDSLSLAEQVEKEAAKKDVIMNILLEVNIAGEDTKWGFTAETVKEALPQLAALPHVHVLGLMTSAPYTEDAETNRIHFRNLKGLFEEIKYPNIEMKILSMGMTGDYVVAVEEGSTMIRVGTGIFGARDYSK